MVPEKRSEMDIIFGHIGLFFALLPHKKLENQKFKKVKKRLEVLSFYTCTINDNHTTTMQVCCMVPEIGAQQT